MNQRIGLYGGSFDPIHLGHLLVAQAAREEMDLDLILFVPAAQSPFKPHRELAPGHLRVRMLRLALAGLPWCQVDTQELERGGISYSIETVRHCQEAWPGNCWFYLIGADHVSQLHKWRDAEELARRVEFIVIPRPGETMVAAPAFARTQVLAGWPLGISSSQIRERVKKGQPIELLTGPAVAEAIRNNRLYL